jgi:hypothetical protein
MGTRQVETSIATQGGVFTGVAKGDQGEQPIEGQVDGDTLTWTTQITSPMPMTLAFTARVDGDAMTGTVKLGAFGAASLRGVRA